MEATITTIGEVFKSKVQDSMKIPTIWVDLDTGTEYEDYDHAYISSKDPSSYLWSASRNALSYVDKLQKGVPEILFVRGAIKQVGSHVKYCGSIYDRAFKTYPFLDNLSNLFKYAINLELLQQTFSFFPVYGELKIPEDLLWGCPNLIDLSRCFSLTNLREIPSNLFVNCPKLKSIQSAFYATGVKEIPEDLFKNNHQLVNFKFAFSNTNIEKIPDNLFDPVMDGILDGSADFSGFVGSTLISKAFTNWQDAPKTEKERKEKRDKYLTKNLPREVQWALIGGDKNKINSAF